VGPEGDGGGKEKGGAIQHVGKKGERKNPSRSLDLREKRGNKARKKEKSFW